MSDSATRVTQIPQTGPDEDLLNRYRELRAAQRDLNDRLIHRLGRSAVLACAKRLGLVKRGAITLSDDNALSVLFDFCIYDHRPGGKNAVERYRTTSPAAVDSDEMRLLAAMAEARFSLYEVVRQEPDIGVELRDLLRGDSFYVMDEGLGKSAPVGLVLAARLVRLAELNMTTGAPLPVLPELLGPMEDALVQRFERRGQTTSARVSAEELTRIAALVLRPCLQAMAVRGAQQPSTNSEPTP